MPTVYGMFIAASRGPSMDRYLALAIVALCPAAGVHRLCGTQEVLELLQNYRKKPLQEKQEKRKWNTNFVVLYYSVRLSCFVVLNLQLNWPTKPVLHLAQHLGNYDWLTEN
jgi:hypothetical protein